MKPILNCLLVCSVRNASFFLTPQCCMYIFTNFVYTNQKLFTVFDKGVPCGLDGTFFCDNSNCIADEFVCDKDGSPDCIDGTDEGEATCELVC